MKREFAGILMLLAGLGLAGAEAGYRSPESLVRNVYAHYGRGAPEFSRGLPHDEATARQFFDPSLRKAWAMVRNEPYDFLVQGSSWKLGAVSISVLRRQYDRTYVTANFNNNGRAVSLNFIAVRSADGWLIADVESPYDSLRMFLEQFRN
jgi:hypothetical protein